MWFEHRKRENKAILPAGIHEPDDAPAPDEPEQTLDPAELDLTPAFIPVVDESSFREPSQVVGSRDNVEAGSLVDYWRILVRKKWTVILMALIGLGGGAAATVWMPPMYQARASLEVEDVNQEFMNLKVLSPVSDASAISGMTDVQTQVKILQSTTLLERAMGVVRQSSPGAFRALESDPAHDRDWMLHALSKNLKAGLAGTTRIIEITFDWTDPKVASAFTNALTQEFINQNIESRWQLAQRTSEWLVQQLDDARGKLERAETALQNYARQNQLIYTADKQNISEEKLRQVMADLSRAEADRLEKQSRYQISRTAPVETLAEVLNDGNLRSLQNNLNDLRREESELLTTFKPDYSKVKKVHASIESLEASLEKARGEILGRIANDYQSAVTREKLLSDDYAGQMKVVAEDKGKSIQYNILERDVETNRQMYESMLQRVKESSMVSAMRASNIRVIDHAHPPRLPYKPNLPVNLAAGFGAGFAAAALFVVIRVRMDRSMHLPGDAGDWLGVPELGAIPSAGRPLLPPKGNQNALIFPFDKTKWATRNVELAAWQNAWPAVADSFRAILTSIYLSSQGYPRVLVITSAGPGEGKTTVASNLAITLSQVYRRVLLIDADVRKPSLHRMFGRSNDHGLTDLLQQNAISEAHMASRIEATDVPHLFLLPSGRGDITANLLFTRQMARLVAWCRTEYDAVIIDTPPLLAMPEARMLGRLADAVVLVARAGHTMKEAVQKACQRLVTDRARVLGVVLNDWNPRHSPHGYYGNYGNYGK